MAAPIQINVGANAQGVFNEIVRQAKRAQDIISRNPPEIRVKNFGGFKTLIADADNFSKSVSRMSSVVLTFGQTAAFVFGFENAMAALLKTTVDVEKQLTQIRVLLDATGSEFGEFSKGLFEAARNTSQSFATASATAEEFARQGLSVEETLKRTKDALVLANTSGISYGEAVKTITVAMAGFRQEVGDTTRVVNILNNVDASFAVSTEDLSAGLQRAGATAKTAGVEFNELIALITSLQQTTQRGGAIIGNSLKSLFTRAQRAKSLDIFEGLGVRTTDAEGNVRKIIDVLKEYAAAENNLGTIQKQRNREALAGIFQINSLSALLNDLNSTWSIYDQALTKANNTTDEATRRNEQLNKTLSGLLSQTGTGFAEFASNIGNSALAPGLSNILELVNKVVGKFNGAISGDGDGIGESFGRIFVNGLGNFLAGPGLVLIAGIAQRIGRLVAKGAFDQLKGAFELTKANEAQLSLQQQITAVISSQDASIQKTLVSTRTRAEYEKAVLTIIQEQNNALAQRSSYVAGFAKRTLASGKSAVGKNFASGYMPMIAEQAAINRGIGGASKAAKPVRIPNFNFGGGKKGDVVANTDEYIVKNYIKDGSAIFNKEMIQKMGLPKGAKKINAAGGLMPIKTPTVFSKEVDEDKLEDKPLKEVLSKARGFVPNLNAIRGYGINARPFNFKADSKIQGKFLKTEAKRIGMTADEMVTQAPDLFTALAEEHRIRYPRSKGDLKKSFLAEHGYANGYVPNLASRFPSYPPPAPRPPPPRNPQAFVPRIRIPNELPPPPESISLPVDFSFAQSAPQASPTSHLPPPPPRVSAEKYFDSSGFLDGHGNLKISYLSSADKNPIKELLPYLTAGNIKKIYAGIIVGPKVPNIITGLAKLLPELRKKYPNIPPRIPIEGNFDPNSLFKSAFKNRGKIKKQTVFDDQTKKTLKEKAKEQNLKSIFEQDSSGIERGYFEDQEGNLAPVTIDDGFRLYSANAETIDSYLKGAKSKEVKGRDQNRLKQTGGAKDFGKLRKAVKEIRTLRDANPNFKPRISVLGQSSLIELKDAYPQGLARGYMPNFNTIPVNGKIFAVHRSKGGFGISEKIEKEGLSKTFSGHDEISEDVLEEVRKEKEDGAYFEDFSQPEIVSPGPIPRNRIKKIASQGFIPNFVFGGSSARYSKNQFISPLDFRSRFELVEPNQRFKRKGGTIGDIFGKKKELGLSDLIEFPELFNNYPVLGDTLVKPISSKTFTSQYEEGFKGAGGQIPINRKFSATKGYSVLTHEIQHAIQSAEGSFPNDISAYGKFNQIKGLRGKNLAQYNAIPSEIEALAAQKRLAEDPSSPAFKTYLNTILQNRKAAGYSGGFVPNLAQVFSKRRHDALPGYKTLKLRDETMGPEERDSFVRYGLSKIEPKTILLDYIRSKRKGHANVLFDKVAKVAKRGGYKIGSNTLVPQIRDEKDTGQTDRKSLVSQDASNYDNFKRIFPQLRYREGKGRTSGSLLDHDLNLFQFEDLNQLKKRLNRLPKFNASQIGRSSILDLVTQFKAGGYVPNLGTLGKRLGGGVYGDFFDLGSGGKRQGIGVKRFNASRTKEDVSEELVNDILFKEANLPSYISLPKTFGSIKRSLEAKRIGKEVIKDPLANSVFYLENEKRSSYRNLGLSISNASIKEPLNAIGLDGHDFHGGNYTIGPKSGLQLNKIANRYDKSVADFTRLKPERIQKLVQKVLTRNNEKINLIDLGFIRATSNEQFNKLVSIKKSFDQYFPKSSSLFSGYIPNFASPLKESVQREKAALLKQGFDQGDIDKSLRVQASNRLKNPENPMGLGVFNTLQGQTDINKALSDHRGENLFSAGKHVPNLVATPLFDEAGNRFQRPTHAFTGATLRDSRSYERASTESLEAFRRQLRESIAALGPLAKTSKIAADKLKDFAAAEAEATSALNAKARRSPSGQAAAIVQGEKIAAQAQRAENLKQFQREKKEKRDRRQEKFENRTGNLLFGASIALPLLQSSISEIGGFKPGSKKQQQSDAFFNATSTGASAAFLLPGPPQLKAVAFGLGTLVGVIKAANIGKGTTKTFFDREENLKKKQDENVVFTRNANDLVTSVYNQTAVSKDPNASSLDAANAADAVNRALANFQSGGENIREILSRDGTDEQKREELGRALKSLSESKERETASAVFSKSLGDIQEERFSGIGGKREVSSVTPDERKALVDSLVASVDVSKIDKRGLEKIAFENPALSQSGELAKISPEIQAISGDFERLGEGLKSEFEREAALKLLNKAANEQLANSYKNLATAQQSAKQSLEDFGKEISLLSKINSSVSGLENKSKIDLARESLNSPFATQQDKFIGGLDINKAELQASIQERLQSIKEGGLSTIVERAQGSIGGSEKKTTLDLINKIAAGEISGGANSIQPIIDAIQKIPTSSGKESKELSKILDELKLLNTTSNKELDNLKKLSDLQIQNQAKASAGKVLGVLEAGNKGPLGALNEAITKAIITAQKTKAETDRERKPRGEIAYDNKYETGKVASIFGTQFERAKSQLQKFEAKKAIGGQDLIDNEALRKAGFGTPEFDKKKEEIKQRKIKEKETIDQDVRTVVKGQQIDAGVGQIRAASVAVGDLLGPNLGAQVKKIEEILQSGNQANIDSQLPDLKNKLKGEAAIRGANIGGTNAGRLDDAISQIIGFAEETSQSIKGPQFDSLVEAKKSIAVGETDTPQLDALSQIKDATINLLEPINRITPSIETFKNDLFARMAAAANVASLGADVAAREKLINTATEEERQFNQGTEDSNIRRRAIGTLRGEADKLAAGREKSGRKFQNVDSEKALRDLADKLEKSVGQSGQDIVSQSKIDEVLKSDKLNISVINDTLKQAGSIKPLPSSFSENGTLISLNREGDIGRELTKKRVDLETVDTPFQKEKLQKAIQKQNDLITGRTQTPLPPSLVPTAPQTQPPSTFPLVPTAPQTADQTAIRNAVAPTPQSTITSPAPVATTPRATPAPIYNPRNLPQIGDDATRRSLAEKENAPRVGDAGVRAEIDRKKEGSAKVEVLNQQTVDIAVALNAIGGGVVDFNTPEFKAAVAALVRQTLNAQNKAEGKPPPSTIGQ